MIYNYLEFFKKNCGIYKHLAVLGIYKHLAVLLFYVTFVHIGKWISLALIFDVFECACCSWFVICSKLLKVSDRQYFAKYEFLSVKIGVQISNVQNRIE